MFCQTVLSVIVINIQLLQVWSGCPNGWQDGVGMCYIQMKNTSDFVPWGYANAQCKAMDVRGRLPVFKDAMSWNVFTMGVKQIRAQLKAQGTPPPGPKPVSIVPFGAYKLNDEWYWLDGSKMSDGANNWQSGEPNGTNVPENCVGFNPMNGDVGYEDIECSLHFGFVCQLDPGETIGKINNGASQEAVMSPPSTCATGWDSVGGACYKEPSATVTIATPDEGAAICAKVDPKARLPEFFNARDYDDFIRYIATKVDAEHRNIPLGFRKNGAKFVNSDGKGYFLNWYQDEPADGKSCAFINDVNGYMWTAMDCTEKGVVFCQLDSRTVQSVAKSISEQSGGPSGGTNGGSSVSSGSDNSAGRGISGGSSGNDGGNVRKGCPSGWQDGVGMCYIQMKNTSDFVSWGAANAQCKAMDVRGRLPVFKDAMSWNVFTMGVKQIRAQLKAQGTPPPGPKPVSIVPFGAYKLNDEWYWLDGSKMSDGANNWQSGEPNGTNVPENCVGFNPMNGDVGYGDVECSLHFGFICQLDPGETTGKMNNGASIDAMMSSPTACPTGWDAVGGACYKEPSATVTIATPDQGAAVCAKLDPKARLPEFYNSKDYDDFIRYVGGTKVDAEHLNIPLGFRKNGANFVNSDGETYFLNWYKNEPAAGSQMCAFANDLNGFMWSAMSCDEKGVIICQFDSRIVQSIPKAAPAQSSGPSNGRYNGGNTGGNIDSSGNTDSNAHMGCPHKWQDAVGLCYYVLLNTSDFLPWGYANARCKAMDVRGRLPVVHDPNSWNFLTMGVKNIRPLLIAQSRLAEQHPVPILPLGAYMLNNDWYWLDGSKLSSGLNNWQMGQPYNRYLLKNCLGINMMNDDVGYEAAECSYPFKLICQLDPNEKAGKMNNGASKDVAMSPAVDCPEGWESAGGACYKEPGTYATILTPQDGVVVCTEQHPKARLPEFYNSKDYDGFIRYIATKLNAEHNNIPLGIRNNDANFVNSDGKAYFLNWYQNEPAAGKTCAFTNDLQGYMWSALDCTEIGVIFCQLDLRTVQSDTKNVSSSAKLGGSINCGSSSGSCNANVTNASKRNTTTTIAAATMPTTTTTPTTQTSKPVITMLLPTSASPTITKSITSIENVAAASTASIMSTNSTKLMSILQIIRLNRCGHIRPDVYINC